jgi:hypothetical protein
LIDCYLTSSKNSISALSLWRIHLQTIHFAGEKMDRKIEAVGKIDCGKSFSYNGPPSNTPSKEHAIL